MNLSYCFCVISWLTRSPLMMAVMRYLPSCSAGSTRISPTVTSLPCLPSRNHPLLSSKSCPSTIPTLLFTGSCCTCNGSTVDSNCIFPSNSCCTSGRKPIWMRSLLLSMPIVILSAKSSLMTLFNISSRLATGTCLTELLVNAFNSSSVKSYTISLLVLSDWMVSVFAFSSMMIPCEDRHSCH